MFSMNGRLPAIKTSMFYQISPIIPMDGGKSVNGLLPCPHLVSVKRSPLYLALDYLERVFYNWTIVIRL